MVENGRRRLDSIPDSPESPISSDLDWALQSSQASISTVIEILVHEYYGSMYNLAYSLLGDSTKCDAVVKRVILTVLTQKDRFRWEFGVKAQLYKLIYKECNRYSGLAGNILEYYQPRANFDQASSELELHAYENASPWGIVDDLPMNEKLVLIFFYGYGLDIHDIAEIMQIKDDHVNDLLLAAKDRLHKEVGIHNSEESIETQLARSMRDRWPMRHFREAELQEIVYSVQKQLDKKSERRKLHKAIQQAALGGGVIALIFVIWWLTTLSAGMNDPGRRIVETVIVTKIVEVPKPTEISFETPSQATTVAPLTVISTPQEIRNRMNISRVHWDTLWVNGLIIQYGPPGYVGPPRVRRDQVWINQPNASLVLSGSRSGNVNHAWYSVNGRVYVVDLETGHPMYYDYHGDELSVYSSLESLIFPRELEVGEKALRVSGSGRVAGRETIIVDWIGPNEDIIIRTWIDVYTGILLRLQQFAEDAETVTYEVLITSIVVDKEFEDNTLNRQNLKLEFIQEDALEEAPSAKRSNPLPQREDSIGQRTPHPKLYPADSYDPSEGELKFNWSKVSSATRLQPFLVRNRPADDTGETQPIDVYADGYHIGQVLLNPWSVTCDRSPDGRLLAFVTRLGEEGKSIPTLGWIDLLDFSEVRFPSLDLQPGWRIAFSPDSQKIAFQGCNDQDCGIYTLNVNTLELQQVSSEAGENLTWSQDGDHLAWIETESTSAKVNLHLVNTKTDEMVYYEYSLDQGETFENMRVDELGVEFTEQDFGLAACS